MWLLSGRIPDGVVEAVGILVWLRSRRPAWTEWRRQDARFGTRWWRSVIYNPNRALQRATRLMPNLEAEMIPDASHALNAEKSELVNARILQFCLG